MSSRKMTFSIKISRVRHPPASVFLWATNPPLDTEFWICTWERDAENETDIESIEDKREMNPTMDAIYLLSPQPHIVDCLLADFDRRRYKKSFLVWTAVLDPPLRRRIDNSPFAQQQLAGQSSPP